jgi:hypothetical protein
MRSMSCSKSVTKERVQELIDLAPKNDKNVRCQAVWRDRGNRKYFCEWSPRELEATDNRINMVLMPLRDHRGLKDIRIKMLMNPNGSVGIRVSNKRTIIHHSEEFDTPEQIIKFVDVCYDLLTRGGK